MEQDLVSTIFLIFFGAAVLSTAALFLRQSTLVAYMALGMIVGPWGLKLLGNLSIVSGVGDVGIIFLLFLLGLHLPPQKLIVMMRKIASVGVISSVLFFLIGFFAGLLLGFSYMACSILGAALMFSSTIIGIKLLPTTILHHQHTGEVMISVLLFQDILAIIVLLLLSAFSGGGISGREIALISVGFPVMIGFAYLMERFVLRHLFSRFNRVREYLFLLAIGWCLLMTEMAVDFKLSAEIGAFIAGVSLAASPVSVYIAESLKPVRDFFLIMFFFSVGATLNLTYLPDIIIPALILTVLMISVKPWIYKVLLRRVGESQEVSWEVGVRLGQISEFSLIIAYFILAKKMVPDEVGYLIEAVAILTFAVSSYWVVMRYPTPLATQERLRRD
jgi:Kef-type K+ transport system membrane component KefB